MATQPSLWQRISRLFGNAEDAAPHMPGGNGPNPLATTDNAWWPRRSARASASQEMVTRICDLSDAMQRHFEQQDQRATELAGSLNRIGGILEQLAQSQRDQGEFLKTIAERSEASARHAATLTETLGRVPESLKSQADAVRAVARQMEVAQESDTQLMHSLQQFGRAVDTLGSSGTAQVQVLQQLNEAQQQQHENMTALVRAQSTRFLVILVVAAVLALAGLSALAMTLILLIQRGV